MTLLHPWPRPILLEKDEPSDQTLLELHTMSLIPEEALEYFSKSIGDSFDRLSEIERLILVTAYV